MCQPTHLVFRLAPNICQSSRLCCSAATAYPISSVWRPGCTIDLTPKAFVIRHHRHPTNEIPPDLPRNGRQTTRIPSYRGQRYPSDAAPSLRHRRRTGGAASWQHSCVRRHQTTERVEQGELKRAMTRNFVVVRDEVLVDLRQKRAELGHFVIHCFNGGSGIARYLGVPGIFFQTMALSVFDFLDRVEIRPAETRTPLELLLKLLLSREQPKMPEGLFGWRRVIVAVVIGLAAGRHFGFGRRECLYTEPRGRPLA